MSQEDRRFADDIAVLDKTLKQAEHMLHCVENSAAMVGLHLNTSQTELMALITPGNDTIKSLSGATLKRVDTVKYLSSHLPSSLQDSNIRKEMSWDACNKLDCIWKSDLDMDLKIRLFRACIESVLLYGSETWTITAKMKQRIDG